MDDELTLLLTLEIQAQGQEALAGVAAGLEMIAAQAGTALQQLAPFAESIGALAADAAGLGAALQTAVSGIDWTDLAATLSAGLQGALDAAIGLVRAGGAAAAALTGAVEQMVAGIDWSAIGVAFGAFGALLEADLPPLADAALGRLTAALATGLDGIPTACQQALQRAGDAIAALGPAALGTAIGATLAAVDQALADFVAEATAQGEQLVQGLWQGIANLAGWMATNVPEWLDANVLTPIDAFFGIAGPSAVMVGVGAALTQGLMDGMTALAMALLTAATGLVTPILPALQAFTADFTTAGGSLMDALAGGIAAKAGEIANQARSVVQGAINAAEAVLNGIEGNISAAQATVSAAIGGAIGHNAGGTDDWRGGMTWVGENGPELINLPPGAQVMPLSGAAAGTAPGVGGTVNVYVTGNTVMSETDADDLATRVGQVIVRQTGFAYSLVR